MPRVDVPITLPDGPYVVNDRGAFATALDEYVAAQLYNADRPEGRMSLGNLHAASGLGGLAGAAVLDALTMLGSLTIPLALLAIGVQLGALPISVHRLPAPLWGVVLVRLLLAPLATIAVGLLLARAGYRLPAITRRVVVLVASMPVALVCSVIAERYGGDAQLAAQAVFLSTLFSLVTVPALFYLVS